jgi:hypothetical protein
MLDAGPPAACDSGTVTYTGLAEGPHTFSVTATDQAPFSNVDRSPATREFSVDLTPPDTTIDSGPSGLIATDEATFAFSGSPAGDTAKVQCRIDSGPFTDCADPVTFQGLAEGPHTVEFRAQDAAGNQDPTPATRSFTVDTTAPKLRLRGAKKQRNPGRLVVKARCVDEACTLRATGRITVKILKKNGKVRKTKTLKLRRAKASGAPGRRVKLKVKLNRRAKKLVRKSFRRRAAKATVRVRAADSAGNASFAKRKVKLVRK